MKITYTYRDVKSMVCENIGGFQALSDGTVAAMQRGWVSGNHRNYCVEIATSDILPTVKTLLQQLSNISGLQYDIAVSINNDPYKVLK